MIHKPVMVNQVLRLLLHESSSLIVDGTVGGGGHAEAILTSNPDVRVIGLDRDGAAIELADQRLRRFGKRIQLHEASYSLINEVLREYSGSGKADGVLLDMGMSSYQLDSPGRGFSYMHEGPLDMRMGRSGKTAQELIAAMNVKELSLQLGVYGEISRSKSIARAIKRSEQHGGLHTTIDLKNAVEDALRSTPPPSLLSKIFQALRIVVNQELENLKMFLRCVLQCMNPEARLVFLSYNSLEDRLVKQFLKRESSECVCPPGTPVCICGHQPRLEILTRRAVKSEPKEIEENPRARSARLRAAKVL